MNWPIFFLVASVATGFIVVQAAAHCSSRQYLKRRCQETSGDWQEQYKRLLDRHGTIQEGLIFWAATWAVTMAVLFLVC